VGTVKKSAYITPDGRYRYCLMRRWGDIDGSPYVLWVMLNPSTADAEIDDPTITRCIKRTSDLGYDAMAVVNLYGLRATNPDELWRTNDPIGGDNDLAISMLAAHAGMIICAWGSNAKPGRAEEIIDELLLSARKTDKIHALKLTKNGVPMHPLYIGYDVQPFVWKIR
jgi:hypothetical protein